MIKTLEEILIIKLAISADHEPGKRRSAIALLGGS